MTHLLRDKNNRNTVKSQKKKIQLLQVKLAKTESETRVDKEEANAEETKSLEVILEEKIVLISIQLRQITTILKKNLTLKVLLLQE